MTRVPVAIGVLLFGLLLMPSRGDAQISPLQVEARVGAWLPTSDLAGAQGFEGAASADVSFGFHFVLRTGLLSYRAGFSEHRFGCALGECDEAVDFVSTGWDLGIRTNLRESGIVPWLSLGATTATYDAHVNPGDAETLESSDRGWGYEVGAGVIVPVAGAIAFNPGVRYGRNDAEFDSRGKLETRYIVVDVGFVLAF
jgi:hypothetical protein